MEPNLEHPFAEGGKTNTTKDRILLEAAILFAYRGYAAVSVRDIADRVKIKPASLYNYFSGKEELYDVIIDNICAVYLTYYDRLDERMAEARSFRDVLDAHFTELRDVYNIFVYYGVSLITSEQYRDEKARAVFNEILLRRGIDNTKKSFDISVERHWVKPFDTETLATLIMNNVLVGSLLRTHEDMKHETAYDVTKMFTSLQRYIYDSVEIIEPDGA